MNGADVFVRTDRRQGYTAKDKTQTTLANNENKPAFDKLFSI
jgi:hypothetical protein